MRRGRSPSRLRAGSSRCVQRLGAFLRASVGDRAACGLALKAGVRVFCGDPQADKPGLAVLISTTPRLRASRPPKLGVVQIDPTSPRLSTSRPPGSLADSHKSKNPRPSQPL